MTAALPTPIASVSPLPPNWCVSDVAAETDPRHAKTPVILSNAKDLLLKNLPCK